MSDRDKERSRLTTSAAVFSISVALLLAILKIWAVAQTGSAAMLGSLADTTLDLIASIATLIGVWVAAMPADEDHRWGHGKAEALSAMLQVVLITLSAFGILIRSIDQWVAGARTDAAEEGIVVSVVAMLATVALLAWQRHVIRKTRSIAIATDHLHYMSDLLLNLAVIAALVMDQYVGIAGSDPFFGVVIALWLAWGAWRASHDAIDALMDKEWPEEERERFLHVISGQPELRGAHDLRTRTSGSRDFAQFHAVLAPDMTVSQAHKVMDELEERIEKAFPGVEALIHIDPEGRTPAPGEDKPVELLPELANSEDS